MVKTTPRPLAGHSDQMIAFTALRLQNALNEYLDEMQHRNMNLTCSYDCRGKLGFVTWNKTFYTPVEVAKGIYHVIARNED